MLLQLLYVEHVRVYLSKCKYVEHVRVYLIKCYSSYYM